MARFKGQRDITTEEFDQGLQEIIESESAASFLTIPGVYEILSEYYNNEVISNWEERMYQEEQENEENSEEEV